MGQMYPRKPFAGFARPMDPDALLRDVRVPSIPPPAEPASSKESAATADDASNESSSSLSGLSGLTGDIAAFTDRFSASLKENTLTTLGTTLAIGVAFGAIFGSKIGRIALLIAAGALLQNFAVPTGVATTRDAARRSGV